VESVLELGIRLRAAQGTLGAADLRALDEQRRQLTRAVAVQAVAIATSPPVARSRPRWRRTSRRRCAPRSNGLEPVDLSRVVALADRVTGHVGGVPVP
jgi:hypothetical protein